MVPYVPLYIYIYIYRYPLRDYIGYLNPSFPTKPTLSHESSCPPAGTAPARSRKIGISRPESRRSCKQKPLHTHIHTHTHPHTHPHTHTHTHTHTHRYVYIYIYIYTCSSTYSFISFFVEFMVILTDLSIIFTCMHMDLYFLVCSSFLYTVVTLSTSCLQDLWLFR